MIFYWKDCKRRQKTEDSSCPCRHPTLAPSASNLQYCRRLTCSTCNLSVFFVQVSASWCCWPSRWSATCLCATLDATSPSWGHHVSSYRSSPSWHSCCTSPTSFAMNSNPVYPRLKGRSLIRERTTDASSTPSSIPCIRYVATFQTLLSTHENGFDLESLDRFFIFARFSWRRYIVPVKGSNYHWIFYFPSFTTSYVVSIQAWVQIYSQI